MCVLRVIRRVLGAASSPLVAALGGLLACSGAAIAFLVCYISQRKACVCKGGSTISKGLEPDS